MSGGHYDYAPFRLRDLADLIKEDAELYSVERTDDYGYEIDAMPADILAHMTWVAEQLDLLSAAAYDIEWLMSGDIGEDSLRLGEPWKLTKHLRGE